MNKVSTKEKIISVALDLFHEKGINATSVDDILAASDTGKSQFYYYFKSKEGLIGAVLDRLADYIGNLKFMQHKGLDSFQDLEDFFHFFINMNKNLDLPRACPMGFIGAELSPCQEELSVKVNQIFDSIKMTLKNFFDKAKKKGDFKKDLNTENLAEFCLAVIQGALITAKIRKNIKPLEISVKHALKYINFLRD